MEVGRVVCAGHGLENQEGKVDRGGPSAVVWETMSGANTQSGDMERKGTMARLLLLIGVKKKALNVRRLGIRIPRWTWHHQRRRLSTERIQGEDSTGLKRSS